MSNSTSRDRASQENQASFLKNLVIPGIALHNNELDWEEKITFAFLVCFMNSKGYCYWSNAKLAALMKCSDRTIRRRLEKFEKLGWIERKEEGGKRYIIDRTTMPYSVDNSLDTGDQQDRTPDMGVRPPGHGCPPPPDMGVHHKNIKENNKEKDKLTPPVNNLFKDEGDEKIYRNNAKTSWVMNGLDELFAELWDMTPKYDASDWQLKDHIASFVRTLKKIPESELVANKEKIRTSYKRHLEAHLEMKQNRDLYEGRSGFSNITEWFKQECWKEDVAEAMGMLTMETLKHKPKAQYNARTGREEAPQDRTKMLDRSDYGNLDELARQTFGMNKNNTDICIKNFCNYWRKDFEYVSDIFYQRYHKADLSNSNQSGNNERRMEARYGQPRAVSELFA